VEYSLTPLGTSMRALFDVLSDWGNMHREKLGETPL
jgi:DNA-binding HxlR family transcriptional regulator